MSAARAAEFADRIADLLDRHTGVLCEALVELKDALRDLDPECRVAFAVKTLDRYRATAAFYTDFVTFLRGVQEGAVGTA
jgi:hypothetical protein